MAHHHILPAVAIDIVLRGERLELRVPIACLCVKQRGVKAAKLDEPSAPDEVGLAVVVQVADHEVAGCPALCLYWSVASVGVPQAYEDLVCCRGRVP